MLRYLALLGVHFVINYALLADSVVVSHPVHHDDYANLSQSLRRFDILTARPVSTFGVAVLSRLGSSTAYLLMNLALVACVLLCLRFVELLTREGRPLPTIGFVAAGALAFEFALVIDWTKYLGLVTNMTSALSGLVALCVLAAASIDPVRERKLAIAAVVIAAISFFAKEDFGLPIVVCAAFVTLVKRTRFWTIVTATIAALFAAAIVFNREVGSVFVSGTTTSTDPYFIDLSPLSIATSLGRMLLANGHAKVVVVASLLAVSVAMFVHRRDVPRVLRLALLPVLAVCVLAGNSIFPNHAFAYYAFVPIALLCAALATAVYSIADDRA
jgi:hypothetical protein